MRVLGIETSCDETSVAVIAEEGGQPFIEWQEIASQMDLHEAYGGVVPELATRRHLEVLPQMVNRARQAGGAFHGIAVTGGPGLASSLLIGLSYAKGLSRGMGLPWVAVNHMEGHLYSPFLTAGRWPVFPHLALVVSGGHTMLVLARERGCYDILGSTRDDAAGEAFDKSAKLMGLKYPGGPELERLARDGNPDAFDFPRSMIHSGDFHFSFSGLKTALRVRMKGMTPGPQEKSDLCASFQQAVIDVLIAKTRKALREQRLDHVTLSGGVSGNTALRTAFLQMAEEEGCACHVARPPLTGDNAAMIAAAGWDRLARGSTSDASIDIQPSWKLGAV